MVNLPFLNRIAEGWLAQVIAGQPALFTIDNHYVAGGQGERILATALRLGWRGRTVRQFGLTDIPPCGQADEVLERLGLDVTGLAEAIGAGV